MTTSAPRARLVDALSGTKAPTKFFQALSEADEHIALAAELEAVPIDLERLADALLEIMPRQLKTQALALREITTGTLPTLIAIAAMSLYNKKPGRKILVSSRTFGGGSINARSVRQAVSA